MSLQTSVEDAPEERSSFFIGTADSDNVSEEEGHHHQLVLQKANALASENCLREAIYWFSVALRYGPVRPEQLSTFVECILRNFKTIAAGPEESAQIRDNSGNDVFDCPNCHNFLGEAVTVACGHTYCKRCLQRRLLSKCKLCREAVKGGEEKVSVVLCGLLDKWFPDELKKSKTLCEVDELCRRKRYQEYLLRKVTCIPSGNINIDTQVSVTSFCFSLLSFQPLFRKAMVLHEMGQVDESLQVFFHCLAVDEEFPCAKRQMEKNCNCIRDNSFVNKTEMHSLLLCLVATKGFKQQAAIAKTYRSVPVDLLDASDFECSLCMRLFFEPVTTPCGHTFCKNCLERCLDHTPQCPLCKESLKEYLACRKYMVTAVLDTLIKQYLSQEYAERAKAHLDETKELSDLSKNVPIFVCTMAYPTVPCPLHVFEPRYRLMIRRCMDTGTRQFGMCINDPQKGFADYGCMLIIRSVHFLPDGRSVVDTIGGKRFRVLSRGVKDGYRTADIEHLEDTKVEDSDELERLQELHDAVYEQARVWFQNLKIRFHNQILQHFGPMPEREADIQATPNGPACCWWLLAVLPIDPRYQLSVLSMTSLKERLVKIQHILTYLQSIPNN
uniref:LON peptidase N-terminal domain and ring finger 1 n=1 Tax=Mastacembelus armatus TaxID=205130 RepID=A0A7N8Y1A0_9TELE